MEKVPLCRWGQNTLSVQAAVMRTRERHQGHRHVEGFTDSVSEPVKDDISLQASACLISEKQRGSDHVEVAE